MKIQLTAWREGGEGTPFSIRRILATFFALAAVVLGVLAFKYAASGWFVFIPSGLCIVAVLLLLFFTTWADVAEVVSKVKGA
jgi:hypothetical protein